MSERSFFRTQHQMVSALLSKMNPAELNKAECYFGGGTRIVLELGEYRVSKDVDFMCASQAGYRTLREAISDLSLGAIFNQQPSFAREVRADQYGIRAVLQEGAEKLKFEIVREARIELDYELVPLIGVPCLTRRHAFAEKFLANADRGLDTSTLSRDAIDLAFMSEGWQGDDMAEGWELAVSAYGNDVQRKLALVVAKLLDDKNYRARCIEGLGITDRDTLTAGLRRLALADWADVPHAPR